MLITPSPPLPLTPTNQRPTTHNRTGWKESLKGHMESLPPRIPHHDQNKMSRSDRERLNIPPSHAKVNTLTLNT